jgi:hypothetical protein
MAEENVFERVEHPDDPHRCQAVGGQGQCPFKGIIDAHGKRTSYCPRHTSGTSNPTVRPGIAGSGTDLLRNYRFSMKFQPRIDELANNEKIKSLREEIALVRMVMETVVNRCKDEYDLCLEADRIQKLAEQLNKLVQACHKIEESTGQLLDKTVVINIGSMMVGILEKYVPDKSILDVVGAEIYEAITKSSSGQIESGVGSK